MAGQEWSTEEQAKLHWFFAAAYIADAVGLLDADKAAKLASLEALAGTETWQARVKDSFGLDRAFVRSVYKICRKRMNQVDALEFLLRGFGCPHAAEALVDVL